MPIIPPSRHPNVPSSPAALETKKIILFVIVLNLRHVTQDATLFDQKKATIRHRARPVIRIKATARALVASTLSGLGSLLSSATYPGR